MSGRNVLLVDSEFFYRGRLEKYLRERGYDVSIAFSAGDALKLMRRDMQRDKTYDVVLTEIFIPKGEDNEIARREREQSENVHLGGLDLIAAIKARDSSFPIIALTEFEGDEEYARKYGADIVLRKSMAFEDIEVVISKYLPQIAVSA